MDDQIKNNLLEIRGILRILSEEHGQSISPKKRLMELNKFLKNIEVKK